LAGWGPGQCGDCLVEGVGQRREARTDRRLFAPEETLALFDQQFLEGQRRVAGRHKAESAGGAGKTMRQTFDFPQPVLPKLR